MPWHDRLSSKSTHPSTTQAQSVSLLAPDPPPSPLAFIRDSLLLSPDPAQTALLEQNPHRCLLNCSRQWGKSTITAAKAVHQAFTQPGSLTLVLSPSARQSAEFVRKARSFLSRLHLSPKSDGHNDISLLLPNSSRIIGLPANDEKIRGFSAVSLLLIDEAARVADSLYNAVRPMLAASDGQLWLMSTPAGRRGFFYKHWISSDPSWTRLAVPASLCPRIKPRFLDEERRTLTEHMFRQEYCCEFLDPEDAVFPTSLLERSLTSVAPLVLDPADPAFKLHLPRASAHLHTLFEATLRASGAPAPLSPPHYYIGVDLGQQHDYTAIAILERAEIVSGHRDPVTYSWPIQRLHTIRYLHRLPLGTPYTEVAEHICRITRNPALGDRRTLIVDATGVGRPVVDLIRKSGPGCRLIPVVLTGGGKPTQDGETHRVPRAEILTHLEIALQNERLKISEHLPHTTTLIEELRNLRRTVQDTGNETIQPRRESEHDDFVFATALAHWRTTC